MNLEKIKLYDHLDGEKIVFFIRPHVVILLWRIFICAVLTSVPIILYFLLFQAAVARWLLNPVLGPILILGVSLYFLFMWIFLFVNVTDYWLDYWIVTSERIIGMEQKSLLARFNTEQKLYRIQDVRADINGLFGTIFHYGNVTIQTAGTAQNMVFEKVPDPDILSRHILELIETSRRLHHHDIIEEVTV